MKISDYLVEVEADRDISYQDALIVAMKRERAAFQLYSDLLAKGMVQDEKKRQGYLETMRLEGHHALVHTVGASNLGAMLRRICDDDGIGLVDVVRRPCERIVPQ